VAIFFLICKTEMKEYRESKEQLQQMTGFSQPVAIVFVVQPLVSMT
jgi:hypothetical protein